MDGTALLYCEGALGTPQGRTANSILRHCRRYDTLGVIDSRHAGREASEVVEGAVARVPIYASLDEALGALAESPRYLVIGLTPDDGRLPARCREVIINALRRNISVDSALQPYLKEHPEFPLLAMSSRGKLRSVGYPRPHAQLKHYTGRIKSVAALRIAIVGTTSPVGGKNVTAIRLVRSLRERGVRAELIGTSEESWFQGEGRAVILDSVIQKHVAGELEAAIVRAYEEQRPDVLALEGHGSVLNPANPSGLALLTTARPDAVILQHAPAHESFAPDDAFGAGTVARHIRAIEALSDKPVRAIALTYLQEDRRTFAEARSALQSRFGLPVVDMLADGGAALADLIQPSVKRGAACLG